MNKNLLLLKTDLEANPQEPQCWYAYIDALLHADQYEEAQLVLTFGVKAGLSGDKVDSLKKIISLRKSNDDTFAISDEPNSDIFDEILIQFNNKQFMLLESRLISLLDIFPSWLAGWKILTDTLVILKKDAREAAKKALALNVNDPQEHCYYGLLLKSQGDLVGAAVAFEQAIALKPDYAAAYNNLGIIYKELGDIDKGVKHYRQALALDPNYVTCFSNLLFCLSHSDKISTHHLYKEHLNFAQAFEAPLKRDWIKCVNDQDPNRQLQIGFVSADFRDHSLSYFVSPVLQALCRDVNFNLHAYATNIIEDEVTEKLKKYVHAWHSVSTLNDVQLFNKIRDDRIDILIDLDGHTAGNRLLVFAKKAAPIQMSWLGYLATTGLSAMDYYLADSQLLPRHQFDGQFTEKIIRLPVNAPFTPHPESPEINALPALYNGFMTFACFNRVNKINQHVVQVWARLLNQLPDSRLLIAGMPQSGSYDHLTSWFEDADISKSRIDFHAQTATTSYLKLHQQVDLCLDTFPSSGVTTTCHAAWMGVPTLCLEGNRLSSRGALAVLNHLDLNAFVAKDAADFVHKGMYWAGQVETLSRIRQKMRTDFLRSKLSSPSLVADGLAMAMRKAWSSWCRGASVESMDININE